MAADNDVDIRYLAKLARFNFSEQESEQLSDDIKHVIGFIDTIIDTDVTQANPMVSVLDTAQYLREDRVTEKDGLSKIASLPPSLEAGLFLVPQIIE